MHHCAPAFTSTHSPAMRAATARAKLRVPQPHSAPMDSPIWKCGKIENPPRIPSY